MAVPDRVGTVNQGHNRRSWGWKCVSRSTSNNVRQEVLRIASTIPSSQEQEKEVLRSIFGSLDFNL